MPWPDTILAVALALWALGTVLFNLPLPALRRRLDRVNFGGIFSEWSLFASRSATLRPGTFELYFRDRSPDGGVSEWRLGASGHRWTWTAFFWLPDRFAAAAVQNIGREIRSCFQQRPPQGQRALARARLLEAFVERRHPRAENLAREFRLVRRFVSTDTVEKVFEFPGTTHADRD